jgi:hypothetical protein
VMKTENLEIYSGEGKKLQETTVSVSEPYLDQNYHVYQDNYYNNFRVACLHVYIHTCIRTYITTSNGFRYRLVQVMNLRN